MELVKKELRVKIAGGPEDRTLFLKGDRQNITVGNSKGCDIRIDDPAFPSKKRLFEKRDSETVLHLSKDLEGTVFFMGEPLNIPEIDATSLPLPKTSSGKISVGNKRIFFDFVESDEEPISSIPTHFPGPFSLVRLKTIGSKFFNSLGLSFLLHACLIIAVMAMPYETKSSKPERVYVSAKAALGPSMKGPTARKEEGRIARVKPSEGDSQTLLAMIDSRSRIKGFVRNLYFSKSDSIDIKMRETPAGGGESSGGLFTNINNIGSDSKVEKSGQVSPLFASVENSGALTEKDSGSFIESELITEKPRIEGNFSNDAVSSIAAKGEGALRFCYEEALIRDPETKGRVVVIFDISSEGQTTKAQIETSSVNDKLFERCILRKVTRWRFPKPKGGAATIKYPFVFYTTKSG